METSLEDIIIRELLYNEPYTRKVIPFLKKIYFQDAHIHVFDLLDQFFTKHNKLPTKEIIKIEIGNKQYHQTEFESVNDLLDNIGTKSENSNIEWLVEQTEKFCKERAVDNALSESILINEGSHKTLDKGSIPKILQDALAVSFDTKIGHDYLEDFEHRYDSLHSPKHKIPFKLKKLNQITRGGVQKKTLNLVSAASGVGKSIFLCEMAADYLSMGLNVIYFTLELSEESVANRIDANLLDITMDHLETWTKEKYIKKMEEIKKKYSGKLLIKEFPPSSAHVGHFRHVIHEAKIKKNFIPDIVITDYLSLCLSSRVKTNSAGAGERSYMLKSVAEEQRALAIELNVPYWSAVQFKRSDDTTSGKVDMDHISESIGIQQTMDFGIGLIENDTLAKLNQLLVVQLKNRYNDKQIWKKFFIGLEKAKMKFYDLDDSAQKDLEKINDPVVKEYEEVSDIIDEDEKDMKIRVSQENGSTAYKSAYHHPHLSGVNNKKSRFSGLKV